MSSPPRGDAGAMELEIAIRSRAAFTKGSLTALVEQMYEEHYEPLYRYLVLSGCSPVIADEILQETFLRLLRFLRQGHRVEKPRHWLFRVVHNLRTDEYRRASSSVAIGYEEVGSKEWSRVDVDPAPTPEGQMLESERFERLRAAMQQLTARQYQYLLLRAEGLKLREIAEMFEVTVQSVAEVCARAMDRLGGSLNE